MYIREEVRKMTIRSKRTISALLALAIIIGMLPIYASGIEAMADRDIKYRSTAMILGLSVVVLLIRLTHWRVRALTRQQ
jgi:uncharacterized membrane protein